MTMPTISAMASRVPRTFCGWLVTGCASSGGRICYSSDGARRQKEEGRWRQSAQRVRKFHGVQYFFVSAPYTGGMGSTASPGKDKRGRENPAPFSMLVL